MNKKNYILLPFLFLSLMALTACGSDGGSSDEEVETSGSEEESEETAFYTDALDRDVEIPEDAERIVAINYFGELTALDIKPVGALDYDLDKYGDDITEGIESVGGEEADVEKILELEPDLIISADYVGEDAIENYEKVAPTVAFTFGEPALEQLETIAGVLGEEDAHEAWLEEYNTSVEEARSEMEPYIEEGETAAVMQFFGSDMYMYPTSTFPTVYDAAEFEPSEKAGSLDESASLSEEVIPEYVGDADRIFVMAADPTAENTLEELQSKDVWSGLPAVENEKVYTVDNAVWSDFNATMMERQLEDIVEKVTAE
ncbi:ABC transporter substrate-binding protein [Alteribacillus sp. HJP-4]|uniref:ABC transporter substrate-binding protein n=1 Tax=Alteribacillus sp. HJP-4 TaxID=2775394 RepID=UPI0035CD0C13